MKMEVIGFVEAVERLADRVGFRLTYEGGGSSVQRDRGTRTPAAGGQQAGRRVLRRAAAHPGGRARDPVPHRPRVRRRRRRSTFGCGYAPAGWDTLTKHLLAAGFSLDELIKAGLSKEGRRGPIDRFHRRLLWPIRDLGGDVVGFGARRLFDDDGIEAKYLNTSDTPVYRKTQVLFGLDLAKREIAKRRQVVVVEGYTDVMAMHLAGVPTAVASCGTAFGAEHIAVIRRLIGDDSFDLGEVIYTFDGDAAGQAAALKAFEGDQSFAAQTFVARRAGRPGPLRAAPDPRRHRRARPGGPPRAAVRVRDPLDAARARPGPRRGPGGRAAAHGAARRPDQARGPARRVRPPARRLDQLGRHRDGRAPGAGDGGRARRAGARRRDRHREPPRRRPRTIRGCTCQREALKAALQVPGGRRAELRRAARAGVHPPRVRRRAPRGAGGRRRVRRARGLGLAGGGARRVHRRRSAPLVTELAVEPLELPRRNTDEARYVGERHRRGAAGAGRGAGGRAEVAAAAHQPGRGPRRLPPALRRPRAAGAVPDRAAGAGGAG